VVELGERVQALRESASVDVRRVMRVARLLRVGGRRLVVAWLTTQVVLTATSVLAVITLGQVIGRSTTVTEGGARSGLVGALVAFGAVAVVEQVLGALQGTLAYVLSRSIDGEVRSRLRAAMSSPTTITLSEDPAALDLVSAMRLGNYRTAGGAAVSIVDIAFRYGRTIAQALVLARFSPVLAALLFIVLLYGRRRFNLALRMATDAMKDIRPALRRAWYIGTLVDSPNVAKENRIFGSGPFLVDLREGIWRPALHQLAVARRKMIASYARTGLVITAAFAAVNLLLARSGLQGVVEVGLLATYLTAASRMAAVSHIGDSEILMFGGAQLEALIELEDKAVELRGHDSVVAELAAAAPHVGIRFEGVGFAYPGRPAAVFDGLDLTINAGQSLAVVGLNGAGKTTLIKLLSMLYRPDVGRITVDGVDLADVDAEAWRRRLAVIFQDFVHYPVSAADNIRFGAPGLRNDAAVAQAARHAGAAELVAALPSGRDTTLSKSYAGGTDLSGGQWQRIALARALYAVEAGAGVLVLDEPTANLDVRAEAELFDRFIDLTAGLTTILVSHRFSTVRKADRIVVIDEGRVRQDGTHEDLMAQDGPYRDLFNLQAARFQTDTDLTAPTEVDAAS
jgi:ATP-binding cassette subfamily B protein